MRHVVSRDDAVLVEQRFVGQQQGAGVLGVLAVPALVALVPLLVRSKRSVTLTAVALTGAAIVASASVGIFLIPTVALAWVAVVATRRSGESG